jgi:iron complex outermembrane recepter protein
MGLAKFYVSILLVASLSLISFHPARAAEDGAQAPPAEEGKAEAPAVNADKKQSKEKVEELVITGSRLTRDNLGGLGPMTVLSSDEVSLSGVTTVDQLLRDLPSVGFSGINQNNNNGGNGLAFVELRNLGVARTLVLVNNRRFVTNSSGVAEAVDINNVPTALIERVDVLRDGVSTIYGSDAVAGVINFVLKDNFEGFQAEVFGGISEEKDGEEAGLSLLWGKNWERANLTLSGILFSRSPVFQRDRSFARNPIVAADFVDDDPSQPIVTTIGSGFVPEGRVGGRIFRPSADGTSSLSPFTGQDRFNFANSSYLIGEMYRSSESAYFTYQLSDSLEFFSEAEYTRRDGQQRLASVPAGATATKASPAGFTFPVFQDRSRNNPFLPADFVDSLFTPGDTRESVPVTLNRRFEETGPRVFQNESRTMRFVTGLRGDLPGWSGPLQWEVFGNYGRNQNTEFLKNQVNLTRALRSIQPELCAQDPQCVVGNFFGANALFDTPGVLPYIRYKERERRGFHLKEVGASVSGAVGRLPAGEVKLAIGAEYRDEDGFVNPDPLTISGDSAGNGQDPTRGRFIVRDAFFESFIPVLADLPLANELALEVSGRYTDYSTFGGKYLSRYAFSWTPFADIRFRGVYATAFRAPGISDLFGGGADSFLALDDPCEGFGDPAMDPTLAANCAASLPNSGQFTPDNTFTQFTVGTGAQIRTNIGGSPDLSEEQSNTVNLGIVLTPSFLPEVSLAVDYYEIEIDDPIVTPDPSNILNRCFASAGLSSSDCARISRLDDGGVGLVNSAQQNVGKVRTNGLDISARYQFELPLLGPASVAFEGNYVFDFEVTDDNGKRKDNGTIGANDGSVTNFKARLSTEFQPMEGLTLVTATRYIGKARDDSRASSPTRVPFESVPRTLYLDVTGQYQINETYRVILGVRNVTDKQPPRVIDGNANTSVDTYDLIGRFAFLKFQASF